MFVVGDHKRVDGARNKFLRLRFRSDPLNFSFPAIYLHYHPHTLTGEECVTLERVEMISEAFLKEEGRFHMAV